MSLRVPEPLKIVLLVLGTTALYTYIGQLVPQKIVQPPVDLILTDDMGPEELAVEGRKIAGGKGICLTCHTIGETANLRYPDLEGVAQRAETRVEGLSGLHYMARSMYYPEEYIVEGFAGGMPIIDKPPIGLEDDEIIAVLAFLQSLGGTPTVTLETTRADLGVE